MADIFSVVFFDGQGKRLVASGHANCVLHQLIVLKSKHHMETLTLHVQSRPAEPIFKSKTTDEEVSEEDLEEPYEFNRYRRLEFGDHPEYTFDDVFASVNFEAFEELVLTDFSTMKGPPSEVETAFKALPLNMMEEAPTEILSAFEALPVNIQRQIMYFIKQDQDAIYMKIRFDHTKAAMSRVYASTPTWGQKFADTIKSDEIYAVCSCSYGTERDFAAMRSKFEFQKQEPFNSPLSQFYPDPHWILQPDKIKIKIGVAPKDFRYYPQTSFFSKAEYVTIFGVHIASEIAAQKKAMRGFGSLHRIVFQKLPEAKDRAFIAYLKIPFGDRDEGTRPFRLSEGMKVIINMGEYDPDTKELIEWSGTVMSPENGPAGHATIAVRRPWRNGAFIGTVPPTIKVVNDSVATMHQNIRNNRGIQVSFHIDSPTKILNGLLQAVNKIHSPSKQNRTEWNAIMDKALLCNRFDDLPIKDAFASVREEFPDVKATMNLNKSQADVVDAMKTAAGGFTVINGPPGTGKSKMLLETLKPFLRSTQVHTVMVASPTNAAVNSIAINMDRMMDSMKKEGLVTPEKYGLRVHSGETETALRNSYIEERKRVLKASAPGIGDAELDIEDLDDINRLVHENFEGGTHASSDKYHDHRLEHRHLSIGMKMLEVSGVIKGPATIADEKLFSGFTSSTSRLISGSAVDMDEYNNEVEKLWEYTIQNASFIVGTTTKLGSHHMLEAIKTKVKVIMIDEAAHQREDHLIPFFATDFSNLDAFIQVGDWLQLLPMVTTTKEESLFSDQGATSFMARLVKSGFPIYWLNEQHRMVEDIADMANWLTYGGRLITMPDAKLENREVAQAFRKFVKQSFGLDSNFVLFNIPWCASNRTRMSSGYSRYNDLFVIISGQIAILLLGNHKQATVAILTGYTAQKVRLLKMKRGLSKEKIEGVDRLTINTFDGCQGEQYDFVIMDILVSDNRGLGFQADRHRMNVAMTRARNGMVVLAECEAIRDCRPKRGTYLPKFMDRMSSNVYNSREYDDLPQQAWYQP